MKKIILAAVAASLVSAPALAAPFNYSQGPGQGYSQNYGQSYGQDRGDDHGRQQYRNAGQRDWRKGERFDSRYASNYREIRNPRVYHLRDAPRGYRWVQSGDDAVLVAIAGGIIGAILADAF